MSVLDLSFRDAGDLEIDGIIQLFRGFIDGDILMTFLNEVSTFETRRVICRTENVSYDEQIVPNDSLLFKFFNSSKILSLSKKILQTDKELKSMLCWTSIYRKDEFINPHMDRTGDIQLLLCLKNDGFGEHGLFCFETGYKARAIFLYPGDLIFFKAKEITHYTTPLIETDDKNAPLRIVAVSRQFFT
ncbi:hypothetical protein BEL04_18090 [Mucilaginibacter sp. PPCGB 2223]|uniref:hypothetical protein n=1 Tax=Mucilaginibacter sp. PPCGB 2223 TaxID=1886027 RepID=UPI000825A58B|nr:hypothetical protein [Mucilaginibacter sp. PPCGB 2223]OCX51913.1 hypothetical protein BEL04_18090 [Mucilaginibacter sp. PPCGB 2223]